MGTLIAVCVIFGVGYDVSSYNIMRHVNKSYKRRNIWLLGYNTYMIWKTTRSKKRK